MATKIKTHFKHYILKLPFSIHEQSHPDKAHNKFVTTLIRLGLIT